MTMQISANACITNYMNGAAAADGDDVAPHDTNWTRISPYRGVWILWHLSGYLSPFSNLLGRFMISITEISSYQIIISV